MRTLPPSSTTAYFLLSSAMADTGLSAFGDIGLGFFVSVIASSFPLPRRRAVAGLDDCRECLDRRRVPACPGAALAPAAASRLRDHDLAKGLRASWEFRCKLLMRHARFSHRLGEKPREFNVLLRTSAPQQTPRVGCKDFTLLDHLIRERKQ